MSERALEIRAQNYFLLGPLWEISHIPRDLFASVASYFLPRPLPPRADFLQVNGAAAALRAHSALSRTAQPMTIPPTTLMAWHLSDDRAPRRAGSTPCPAHRALTLCVVCGSVQGRSGTYPARRHEPSTLHTEAMFFRCFELFAVTEI